MPQSNIRLDKLLKSLQSKTLKHMDFRSLHALNCLSLYSQSSSELSNQLGELFGFFKGFPIDVTEYTEFGKAYLNSGEDECDGLWLSSSDFSVHLTEFHKHETKYLNSDLEDTRCGYELVVPGYMFPFPFMYQSGGHYTNLWTQINDVKSPLDQYGFSWDDTKQMLVASHHVWDIKAHPDSRGPILGEKSIDELQ
nr:hypothetical protein CFP56_36994 [Quercus suber]